MSISELLSRGGNIFMRCGVYVRVSTDDQRDNGYSIDSQLRMIKEYCEKKIVVLLMFIMMRDILEKI